MCDSRLWRGIKKEVGYEVHHILPKSMGGSNEKHNLVKLTTREHFLAHLLLERFTRKTKHHTKMLKAANFMTNNGKYSIRNSILYAKVREEYLAKSSAIQKDIIGKPSTIYPLDYKYFARKVPEFPVNKYFKQQALILYLNLRIRRYSKSRDKIINLLSFYLVLHAFGYTGVKITTEGVYYRTARLLERSGVSHQGAFQPIITDFSYKGKLPSLVFDKLIPHEFPRGFKSQFITSNTNSDNPLRLIMVKKSKVKDFVELYPVNNWLRLNNPLSEYFYRPLGKSEYEKAINILNNH